MKPYFILSKRFLVVFIMCLVILLFVLSRYITLSNAKIDGSTNEKRVEYLYSLGIQLESEDNTSKEIVIPTKFSKNYNEYNEIQKKQGFDLKKFKGKTATEYKYCALKSKTISLIVYNKRIIGATIQDQSFNFKPLIKNEKK